MILFSRLVMLIIVIVLLVFCMSNLDSVTVKMIGWESPQMPLFLILMFVFFFGFFLALIWQALRSEKKKKEFNPAPVITSEQESKPEKKKTAADSNDLKAIETKPIKLEKAPEEKQD